MKLRERLASLRVRIAVGIGVLSTGVVAVAFLTLQARERSVQRALVEEQVGHQTQLIIAGLEHAMLDEDPQRRFVLANDMIGRLVSHREVRNVEILDKDGVIRVSSEPDRMGHRLDRSDASCQPCHSSSPKDRPHYSWRSGEDGEPILRHVAPIPNGRRCQTCHDAKNTLTGVLVADYAPMPARASAARNWLWLLGALALGGCLTAVAAFFLVDWLVTRRLGGFVTRIRGMAEPRQGPPAGRGLDEISRLERTFDAMATSLAEERRLVVHQEKLASLGELAGSVAHEINNPIGIILNHVEVLKMEKSGTQDAGLLEDLGVLERHARRIASTVGGLLSFSRQAPGATAPFDVNVLVRELLQWAGPQYRDARIDIQLVASDTLPPVDGNREHISQVLLNLLNNARDAMASGGSVRIRTDVSGTGGDWVTITVSDDGPGVPAEHRERIFEPFFTTKPPGRGTGLGLAISSRIVAAHGGRLRLANGHGTGAVFEILLPAAAQVLSSAEPSS